jgi:hypothetical protein
VRKIVSFGGIVVQNRDLEPHIKVLGWIHIVGNIILLSIAACVLIAFVVGGFLTGEVEGFVIVQIVGLVIAGLIAVTGLPGILAGYALLTRKSWGRLLALVVGALNIPNFPFGTAIGVYTFWVLLPEDAADYFGKKF